MLSREYLELLKSRGLGKKYKACLRKFVDDVLAVNRGNIQAIILYGGLVRDRQTREGWSDIDVIVVFKDIKKRNPARLSNVLWRLEEQHHVRIDMSQLSVSELIYQNKVQQSFNSEIINAMSMRKDVSLLVWGKVPPIRFTANGEKLAALSYIENTLNLFRRYLVEVYYRDSSSDLILNRIQRITRWVFSIVRASLRLFNIYAHPYEDSIHYISQVFPQFDISVLRELSKLRQRAGSINVDENIVPRVEIFLEKYVDFVLKDYSKRLSYAQTGKVACQ